MKGISKFTIGNCSCVQYKNECIISESKTFISKVIKELNRLDGKWTYTNRRLQEAYDNVCMSSRIDGEQDYKHMYLLDPNVYA